MQLQALGFVMLDIKVNTWSLNVDIRRFIAGAKKDFPIETQRQAKLLALALASKASPRPKGVKGLAASIPRIWAKRVRGQIGTIIKGAMSLGLFHLARINSASVFKNSYYPGKVRPQIRTTYKKAKSDSYLGTVYTKEVTETSPLYRIMEASQRDPQRALKNLRQLLKARLSGSAPKVYDNLIGQSVDAYYQGLKARAQGRMKGRNPKIPKVYLNTADPTPYRETLAKSIDAHIGTVKAGWVQAGLAIPVKAGPRVPSWLTGKRGVGSGVVNVSDLKTGVVLTNTIGNGGGVNDRTDYVNEAVSARRAALRNGLQEALKAQARKWYVRNRQPIPAALAPGRAKDTID